MGDNERIDCRTVTVIEPGKRYFHPNAYEYGDGCWDGCCADYRCPDCKTEWRAELPQ